MRDKYDDAEQFGKEK
ncbi:hypothetical protein RDI58_017843 [Solanum bulbocastanum]|uniref:Uncharacterized protein n=1 Tax=Solanum bulbocastanum TaxID=147425 RepID=A0AAN8TGU6_SOLBU